MSNTYMVLATVTITVELVDHNWRLNRVDPHILKHDAFDRSRSSLPCLDSCACESIHHTGSVYTNVLD